MTKDQLRAQTAFTNVTQFAVGRSQTQKDRYGGMAHKLPVLIRASGLLQALVFVEARGDNEHQTLLEHLAQTVYPQQNKIYLLQQSRTTNLTEYMHLTREVLAVCLWYKRFGQSILDAQIGGE